MSIRAVGRVVDGHLRVDMPVELAENTEVNLIEDDMADPDDDPALLAALQKSLGQVQRGEVHDADAVLDELCPSRTDGCRVIE